MLERAELVWPGHPVSRAQRANSLFAEVTAAVFLVIQYLIIELQSVLHNAQNSHYLFLYR